MSKEIGIGIGILIGLLIAVLTIINRSESFSKGQKTFLWIACIIFFPGGLLALLIIYLYNSNKIKLNHSDRPREMEETKHPYSSDKSAFNPQKQEPKFDSANENDKIYP